MRLVLFSLMTLALSACTDPFTALSAVSASKDALGVAKRPDAKPVSYCRGYTTDRVYRIEAEACPSGEFTLTEAEYKAAIGAGGRR